MKLSAPHLARLAPDVPVFLRGGVAPAVCDVCNAKGAAAKVAWVYFCIECLAAGDWHRALEELAPF